MRRACIFVLPLTLVSLALFRPALAQGDSSESDTSQQGGAVSAMGRVGNRSHQSGIEIPDYGGDISGIRRLPIGTSAPASRDFIPAWRHARVIVRY